MVIVLVHVVLFYFLQLLVGLHLRASLVVTVMTWLSLFVGWGAYMNVGTAPDNWNRWGLNQWHWYCSESAPMGDAYKRGVCALPSVRKPPKDISFSGYCINRGKGYLLPTWVWKITSEVLTECSSRHQGESILMMTGAFSRNISKFFFQGH